MKFFLLHVSYPPTHEISKYQLFYFLTYRSIYAEDLRFFETFKIMLEITHEDTQDAYKNYNSEYSIMEIHTYKIFIFYLSIMALSTL